MKQINRIDILQEIFGHFQQITQWYPNNFESCAEYHNKAESLIEFLEVFDCGSTGGFDMKNPQVGYCDYKLYDRFLTLLEKKKDKENIKPKCGFTVDDLSEQFNTLGKLREMHGKYKGI